MKPVFSDGKLTVELHKPEINLLRRALTIAQSLDALHQPEGAPLMAALNAILENEEGLVDDRS